MPHRSFTIWVYTLMLIIGLPLTSAVYFLVLLASGALPIDADSIGIPMFGIVLITPIIGAVALMINWLCLRRYNYTASIIAWRGDRPVRSMLMSSICAAISMMLIGCFIADVLAELPPYEYILSCYSLCWLPWLFWLRAASIEQLPGK